ncbi:MAG: bacillithiol biosynthesis cysteine-adding enzyme BshC [Ignavibacteria bacterium]|nr:bacillithiol biosynthesis cysteine-adding enzyme BshC [Ignavibacteria bacterium]
MPVQFTSIPSFGDLYLNYIYDFNSLSKFYRFDYRSDEAFRECIELKKESYLNNKNFFRNDLTEILKEQNKNFGCGDETLENIQILNDKDTFAVVTGQQLGFLSGPYYTILKALNTVQLCEKLREKFPEYKFAPVFWLEADDHDFIEINNVSVISKENELKKISYFENGMEKERYLTPAGKIKLDGFINKFIEDAESSMNTTDFSADLFDGIRKIYHEGADLKTAFAKFMNYLTGDKGIVFIDATDDRIKRMLQPVFEKELGTFPGVCERVIETSVELEENYDVQVKPKAINLFYIHEGNRYLLEPRDGEIFALKNSRTKFTKEELFENLKNNPERFSWNVVTRPICQDYLLPTVAYVGGPSEISYFGQFGEVYKFFNIPMPVIYPRTSVTILEKKVIVFLEKYGLKFEDLLNESELKSKLIANTQEQNSGEIFSELKDELRALFYTYEKSLEKIDINQTKSFSKRNEQFLESLNVAKDRFAEAQSKGSEVISNQLRKILINVYPENTLQERVLNITYFINKYGPGIVGHIYQHTDISDFSHQLLDVNINQK